MAEIDNIIQQLILSILRSSKMTSASPGHINHFVGVDEGGALDISGELEDAIRKIVDLESVDKKDDDSNLQKKDGKDEAQAVGLLKKGLSTIENPASIVSAAIPLLPHTALIALSLALAPFIFDILTKPGGPLDLRFKRIISNEVNAFLSRQSQKDTEMGTRQVIVQAKRGFTASNPANSFNTQKGIREGGLDSERLARLKISDHAKGVFD